MFIPRKGSGPLISKNCDKPALRMLFLMAIFAFTASAFWWHFERRMELMMPSDGSHAIVNEGERLDKNELKKLYAWRDAFEKEWGIRLLIDVQEDELQVPEFPGSTLYIGVGLLHEQATIIFPPLARKALGEGLRTITEEDLASCIKQTKPGPCLDASLQKLWDGFE